METRKAAMKVGIICLKVSVYVMVILGLFYLGQTTYRCTHGVFSDAALEEAPGRTVKVTISETVDKDTLAKVLEENGVIEDASIFKMQMKLQGFPGVEKDGSYVLNTSMKPSEILKLLSGQTKEEAK